MSEEEQPIPPEGTTLSTKKGGDGGDVTFHVGKGFPGNDDTLPGFDGNFIFYGTEEDGSDKEVMKITSKGEFYVKGNLVTTDQEVFETFREYLGRCRVKPEPGQQLELSEDGKGIKAQDGC